MLGCRQILLKGRPSLQPPAAVTAVKLALCIPACWLGSLKRQGVLSGQLQLLCCIRTVQLRCVRVLYALTHVLLLLSPMFCWHDLWPPRVC